MVRDLLRVDDVADIFVEPCEVSVYMDSCRPWVRWDENIDRIVENTFKRLHMEHGHFSGKKVVVKKSPSDSRKEFHANFEVSQSAIENFYRPLRLSSERYLERVGPTGAKLVRRLITLPVVTEIWVKPYEVTIYIGQAFSWVERDRNAKTLKDGVQEAFEQVFGDDIAFVTE